jgi:hypothetical protein
MQNLIRRSKIRAFIQNVTASLTGNKLRHNRLTPFSNRESRIALTYLSVTRQSGDDKDLKPK